MSGLTHEVHRSNDDVRVDFPGKGSWAKAEEAAQSVLKLGEALYRVTGGTGAYIFKVQSSVPVIVITGNIVDGLTFRGPFANANDAGDWATDHLRDEWTVAPITSPAEGW